MEDVICPLQEQLSFNKEMHPAVFSRVLSIFIHRISSGSATPDPNN